MIWSAVLVHRSDVMILSMRGIFLDMGFWRSQVQQCVYSLESGPRMPFNFKMKQGAFFKIYFVPYTFAVSAALTLHCASTLENCPELFVFQRCVKCHSAFGYW